MTLYFQVNIAVIFLGLWRRSCCEARRTTGQVNAARNGWPHSRVQYVTDVIDVLTSGRPQQKSNTNVKEPFVHAHLRVYGSPQQNMFRTCCYAFLVRASWCGILTCDLVHIGPKLHLLSQQAGWINQTNMFQKHKNDHMDFNFQTAHEDMMVSLCGSWAPWQVTLLYINLCVPSSHWFIYCVFASLHKLNSCNFPKQLNILTCNVSKSATITFIYCIMSLKPRLPSPSDTWSNLSLLFGSVREIRRAWWQTVSDSLCSLP